MLLSWAVLYENFTQGTNSTHFWGFRLLAEVEEGQPDENVHK